MTIVLLVTVGTQRAYQADAKLLIRIGRETVTLDPTANTGPTIGVGQSRENEINSELEILKSWDLSQRVVEAIGVEAFLKRPEKQSAGVLYLVSQKFLEMKSGFVELVHRLLYPPDPAGSGTPKGPPDHREAATLVLRSGLKISAQKNSNILILSYEGSSPNLSREVLARVIDFYMEKHINIYRTSGSYSFFDQQTRDLRQQLAGVEEELRRLKNKTGVASIEDHRKFLLNRISVAQQEFEVTQAGLAAAGGRIASLNQELTKFPEFMVTTENEGTSDSAADLLRGRLYELQIKEQELLSKFAESNVLVRETRRQIGEARNILTKEKLDPSRNHSTTRGTNLIHQQLNLALHTEKAALASLKSKAEILKTQLGAARRELEELNNTEFRMLDLQRELGMQEAKYRKYAENREQARIDQALEAQKVSNITIVQPAVGYSEPVRPRPGRNLAVGFFLSLILGIGVAFFWEFLDHSIRTPQDVEERLKLPVLGSMPSLQKEEKTT